MTYKTLFVILIIGCGNLPLIAQKNICKNLYVWDFTDEKGQPTPLSQQIMQEVENALTEMACTVLQRRNYAQITEQVDNEKAVQNLEEISGDLNQQLKSIKAETVLFGQVKVDFTSNVVVNVSFERLATKEILRSEFLLLSGESAYNVQKRRARIRAFIADCIAMKAITDPANSSLETMEAVNTGPVYAGLAGVGVLGGGLFIGGAIKASKAKREYQEDIQPKYEGIVGPEDTSYRQEYGELNQRYKSGQWLMVGGSAILLGGGFFFVKKLIDLNKINATSRFEFRPQMELDSPAAPTGIMVGMNIRYRF